MTDILTLGKYKIVAHHNLKRLETTLKFHKKGFLSSGRRPFTQHKLRALTTDYTIDSTTSLLFVATAASDSDDAHTTYCFHIPTGKLRWKLPDTHGTITLRASKRLLDIGTSYGIPNAPYLARVTYEGKVVKRYPHSCYEYSNDAQATFEDNDYKKAQQLAKRALKTEISPNTKAKMHRILGEIAEHRKKTRDAIHHYEEAIKLNPKIGVKRRLQALRE